MCEKHAIMESWASLVSTREVDQIFLLLMLSALQDYTVQYVSPLNYTAEDQKSPKCNVQFHQYLWPWCALHKNRNTCFRHNNKTLVTLLISRSCGLFGQRELLRGNFARLSRLLSNLPRTESCDVFNMGMHHCQLCFISLSLYLCVCRMEVKLWRRRCLTTAALQNVTSVWQRLMRSALPS